MKGNRSLEYQSILAPALAMGAQLIDLIPEGYVEKEATTEDEIHFQSFKSFLLA